VVFQEILWPSGCGCRKSCFWTSQGGDSRFGSCATRSIPPCLISLGRTAIAASRDSIGGPGEDRKIYKELRVRLADLSFRYRDGMCG